MVIYFQVQDRALRMFLNGLMRRLPFPASAGETPPGLTDALIFYDPLVTPTRPGHILPAGVSASLEAGSPVDAERILIGFISDALTAAAVEHDAELDMLAVEEEDHRRRIKDIETRRARLKELAELTVSAGAQLKDWSPPEPQPPPETPPDAESPAPAQPESSDDASLYPQLTARLRSIMEKTGGVLDASSFDDAFRLTFDLGLSSEVSPHSAAGPLEEFRTPHHRVLHISEYLSRKFVEIYQFDSIRDTERTLSGIRAVVEEHKTRLAKLQQMRRQSVAAAGPNLSADFDRQARAQYQYSFLDARRRTAALTVEEKKQFGILEEELQKLARSIESELYMRFSSSPDFLTTLGRINQAIHQSIQELIRAQEDEPAKADLLARLRETYDGSSVREKWLKMDEQVRRLSQFAKLLAGRSRHRPFTAVTPPPWPLTGKLVTDELNRIQSLDTTLFPEKFLRRRGLPSVLLLPCFGSGLYDWQDGLIVMSLYPENITSAAVAALAEFRMDADDSKELFNSFGSDIKRNRGLGFAKLKELFISDYSAWIQKEAQGFRVMEKDIRSWFERKIPMGDGKSRGRG